MRDATGEMVMVAVGKLVNQSSTLQAEAEGLLKAIQLAELHGMGRVFFETDCLNLQQATSSTSQDRGPLGILFRKIKFLLEIGFIQHKILYCPRACNTPTHVLAAVGSREEPKCLQVWQSDFPVDVIRAVTTDLVGPS